MNILPDEYEAEYQAVKARADRLGERVQVLFAENIKKDSQIAEVRAECSRLVDALFAVEWVFINGLHVCPKCFASQSGTGHIRGCSTGEALHQGHYDAR